ncbi:MAG: multidrug efflux pump subunit AcrB [Enterobacterales bacterium]|jgi:multidrug efflux pump subunit AcrB
MKLTATSLKNPAAVAVAVAIIIFFGLFVLSKLPVQLFPDIERPQITIQTFWRAASPREVESELIEPQEEVLQGLPGMTSMNAFANAGASFINLQFNLDTDMDKMLIEVISRINRVPFLPQDANPPVISLGGRGGNGPALTWFFVQLLPGTEGDVLDYERLVEDIVRPKLESIQGVSGVQLFASFGNPEELQIIFDPYKAADLGIDIPSVAAIAGRANDISGGFKDVGRRRYTIRFAGRYSPDQLSNLILDNRDGKQIKLGDVADIKIGHGQRNGVSIQNGNPAMSMRIDKESGANALETLSRVKAAVESLKPELRTHGLDIVQSFDASVFIMRAINLVTSNLVIGVLLAVGILWWFLRKIRATLIVALAIPVSLFATFIVLGITGRSLNVISLAGLAFAVGMVLDAAIVVLENIVRLRARGYTGIEAAEKGATQVWGALVASTATTVAIFLPVIFLEDVEGQLFSDLALTIAIAVSISLFVAVTVLPAAAHRWIPNEGLKDPHAGTWTKIAATIMKISNTPGKRVGWIAGLISVPLIVTFTMMPSLDYLPPVKRDAVDGFFNLPPGATTKMIEEDITTVIVERLKPYMDGTKEPALKNYYIFAGSFGGNFGIRVKDQSRVKEMEKIVNEEIAKGLPDVSVFAQQGNLFGGFGGGRSIVVNMHSKDHEALMKVARDGQSLFAEAVPGMTARPFPSPEMAEPELRLVPDDRRLTEVGWNRNSVGQVVRSLGDGIYIGEHFDGEKRMNIILKAQGWSTPEELEALPLATPTGEIVQLGDLVEIQRTVGPSNLRRVDRRRTMSFNVNPPDGMSLQEAIAAIEDKIEPQLLAMMPPDGSIRYAGSADSLKTAIKTMSENFLLALVILFMLMSALFRSMKDSLLVVIALPLATVGGVLALRLMNVFMFQPLDLLTMIGFIILLGLVVNNAILLVHQTRDAERSGLSRTDAVQQALNLRMRPIFMSTLTSIFGMLPLLLLPGEGSVIYRGLAIVIVGGMSISTVFTLLLLPSLLQLGSKKLKAEQAPDPVIAGEGKPELVKVA